MSEFKDEKIQREMRFFFKFDLIVVRVKFRGKIDVVDILMVFYRIKSMFSLVILMHILFSS